MSFYRRRPDALHSPVLGRLFDQAAFKFVDIGGRGKAFPGILPLARYAHYYASEPDQREAERLEEELPRGAPWQAVTIINEAIATQAGPAALYMTSSPGMSSLLEPDMVVAGRYSLGGNFAVRSVVSVPAVSLDAAAERYGFPDAAFLKMDTQGTELDILRSGERLVGGSLLGVHTEANFQPFYKGQSLFADLDSYLREQGFLLVSMNRTLLRRSGFQPELYSRRVVAWSHCLYLREPETLATLFDGEVLARQLARLLGLTLAFAHYDLSFEIVAMATRLRLLPEPDLEPLAEEVTRVAANGTAYMLRRAHARGMTAEMLASSFRDRKQLE